ncbi:MAG: DUF1573 domain-containing protein [Sphingobacteriales bacterium]|nr:DUF1573 domain-containing protein [Sphingobacteriales bacterium]MBI3719119.1 DUF1573 domain-containing protein [Sphingobacteriales bacterium]
MKKFCLILVLVCASTFIYAQTDSKATSPAPEVFTLNAEHHDFGKIVQGKPVTYDFVLTNVSKDPLKLSDVHASCGCTTPQWSKEAVAPGATTKINVGFNAMAYGPFEKTVTITYNDGQTKIVTIKGEVRKTADNSVPGNSVLELLKQ